MVVLLFACFLIYLLVGQINNRPADNLVVTCDCSKNVTCVSVQDRVPAYVKNNVLAAHSKFDPYSFMDISEETGYFWGYSMQPTLYEGNILLLKNYTIDYQLKPGEIVRYSTISYDECKSLVRLNRESPYVVHRVKAIYGKDEVHIQGDNNMDAEIINKCQITHIVIGVLYR